MPFFFGPAPIRRTIPYLTSGKLIFRDRVKIMEINYNMYWKNWRKDGSHKPHPHDSHIGLRELYFWNGPQIQYMNPNLQIVRNLEMFPNPFIRCWLDDGKDVLFDCDSKNRYQILDQLIKTLGKTEEIYAAEKSISTAEENPAIFGFQRKRWCMCSVPGQCPCPGVVQLPKSMRGKFVNYLRDEMEKEEKEIIEGKAEPNYHFQRVLHLKQQRKYMKRYNNSS